MRHYNNFQENEIQNFILPQKVRYQNEKSSNPREGTNSIFYVNFFKMKFSNFQMKFLRLNFEQFIVRNFKKLTTGN